MNVVVGIFSWFSFFKAKFLLYILSEQCRTINVCGRRIQDLASWLLSFCVTVKLCGAVSFGNRLLSVISCFLNLPSSAEKTEDSGFVVCTVIQFGSVPVWRYCICHLRFHHFHFLFKPDDQLSFSLRFRFFHGDNGEFKLWRD